MIQRFDLIPHYFDQLLQIHFHFSQADFITSFESKLMDSTWKSAKLCWAFLPDGHCSALSRARISFCRGLLERGYFESTAHHSYLLLSSLFDHRAESLGLVVNFCEWSIFVPDLDDPIVHAASGFFSRLKQVYLYSIANKHGTCNKATSI